MLDHLKAGGFKHACPFFNLKHGKMIKCDLCIFKNWIWSDSPCTYSSNICAEEPHHIDIVDREDPTLVDMINLLWCEWAVFYLHQSNHPKNRSLNQKKFGFGHWSLGSQGPTKVLCLHFWNWELFVCSWWVDSGRLTTFLVALLGHFVMWPHSISFSEVEWVSDSTKFEKLPLFVCTLNPHLLPFDIEKPHVEWGNPGGWMAFTTWLVPGKHCCTCFTKYTQWSWATFSADQSHTTHGKTRGKSRPRN